MNYWSRLRSCHFSHGRVSCGTVFAATARCSHSDLSQGEVGRRWKYIWGNHGSSLKYLGSSYRFLKCESSKYSPIYIQKMGQKRRNE
jgi:hypothetical protein